MRFDLLLFELRLFKSRSQASQAIQQGEALLNREGAKPSRLVRVGDRVTVVTGERRRTYQVIELPHASLSKQAARTLIREVEEG